MDQPRAKVYISKDPMLQFQIEDRKLNEVVIRESPETISFQPTTANSITSSGVSYVLVMTGPTTVLDRNILETITGSLTFNLQTGSYDTTTGAFTAGTITANALSDVNVCVRANPITSVSSSASANIDGVVVQLPNAYAVSSVLNRFNNKASAKASIQSYSSPMYDAVAYNAELLSAASNPWMSIANLNLSEDTVPSRTLPIVSITAGTVDAANKILPVTVQFNVTEALQLPAFNADEGPSKGIYGIKNIAITRTFQNFLRMFQIAFKGASDKSYQMSSASVTFSSAVLNCRYFTPRDSLSLPSTQRLFCPEITVFNSNPVPVPEPCSDSSILDGTGGTQITFNNVISPQVPRYIVIWVNYDRDSLSQPQAILAADRVFPIKTITLSIGNKTTTLQGISLQNLYKVSLESLSYCNYAQFVGQRYGTPDGNGKRPCVNSFPLCLDVALLNLDQDVAAGMRGQISIAATITFVNSGNDVAPSTLKPQGYAGSTYATRTRASGDNAVSTLPEYIPTQCQGYMLLLTPGILQIQDGAVSRVVGLYTMSELRAAEHVESKEEDARKGSLLGHGFWDTLGDIAHVAAPLLGALGRVQGHGLNAQGLNAQGSIGGSVIGGRKMFY